MSLQRRQIKRTVEGVVESYIAATTRLTTLSTGLLTLAVYCSSRRDSFQDADLQYGIEPHPFQRRSLRQATHAPRTLRTLIRSTLPNSYHTALLKRATVKHLPCLLLFSLDNVSFFRTHEEKRRPRIKRQPSKVDRLPPDFGTSTREVEPAAAEDANAAGFRPRDSD